MEKWLGALLLGAALLVPVPASASVIVLDFKGIGNLNPAGDFYDGGEEINYGVELGPAGLAVTDEDDGGTGDFASEASPDTTTPPDSNGSIYEVPTGFDTGLPLDPSSPAASVDAYAGLDATDNLLETLSLVAPANGDCTGHSNGELCNSMPVGVALGGVAKSIGYEATTNQTAFEDNTASASADTVGSSVAIPAILALLGVGLGLAAVMLGRRRWSAHSLKARRREPGRIVIRGVR